MPNQTVKNGLKDQIAPKEFFFSKNNKIFMHLLAPFIMRNLKQLLGPIQNYDMPFSSSKWSFCPEQFFFGKNH